MHRLAGNGASQRDKDSDLKYILVMETRRETIYTLEIAGTPILAFPASQHREAQSLTKEAWLQTDLRQMKSAGKPLWNGADKMIVRAATADEINTFTEIVQIPTGQQDDLQIAYLIPLD